MSRRQRGAQPRTRCHRSTLLSLLVALLLSAGQAHATTATLIADTHLSTAQPAINFGTLTNLAVGNGFTSLLQFDLSPLPTGTTAAQVSRATLRLFVNRADTPGLLSLSPVTSTWGEYSVTSSSAPLMGSSIAVTQVSTAGQYVTIDVTNTVQAWITTPASNFGLALTAGTAVLQFDSKENDLTSHPAELDITLASSAAAGTVGPAGPQGPQGLAGSQGPAGPQGLTGATGATGASGAPGPSGPQGPTGVMNYQGLWSSLTTYPANAVVTYAGSSYLSLSAANKGNTPGLSATVWGLLAAAGQNGTTTTTVTTGTQQTLAYQGAYTPAANYAFGDIVQYLGSSFISLLASNHGNTPGLVASAWGLLAAAQTGPQGVAGPAGPAGSLGPQGLTGPAGPQGIAGPTGAVGPQGTPGLVYRGAYASATNYALGDIVLWQGVTYTSLTSANRGNAPDVTPSSWGVLATQGPAGPTGPQGVIGLTGPQGYQGLIGPAGPAGPAGPIGVQGPAGAQGLTGPQGTRGDLGPQGLQGLPGQAGAQGLPGTAGPTGPQGPMGPTGPAGPAGINPQGAYSSSRNYALADAVTFNGSGYVSLVNSNIGSIPDQSPGKWSLFAAAGVPGAIGPAGPAGIAGSQGATGLTGPAGPQGAVGPQGPPVANFTGSYSSQTSYALNDAVSYTGSTYISLTAGNHGNPPDSSASAWAVLVARGAPGAAGATGAIGPAGQAGAPGSTGPTGPQGPQGQVGPAGIPGINFRDTWLGNASYQTNDAVTFQGSTWIATASSSGVQPGTSTAAWALLAQAGLTGPSGPSGSAATITVGSVTTGASGTAAQVTNSGTSSAAILNFTLPAGATGAAGAGGAGGGASTSGIPFASVLHSVSFQALFYSVNGANAALNESASVLTWVLNGCTATSLAVFSTQTNTVTVTLRTGLPGAMQPAALSCTLGPNTSCTATGSVVIAPGSFADLNITGANGTAAPIWTALACQ